MENTARQSQDMGSRQVRALRHAFGGVIADRVTSLLFQECCRIGDADPSEGSGRFCLASGHSGHAVRTA